MKVPTTSFIDADFHVANKDPFARGAVMADLSYIPCMVHRAGVMKPALFTDAEVKAAIQRALRNPEDEPKSFSRTIHQFLIWTQRRFQ